MTENLKLLINFVWKFMGTVRFRNDHVAVIMGFGDLQWGNILITRVYFVKGLGHNLFSVGQFCDSDLEVTFRRNACFVRNLEGVNLLKGDRSTNLYTINLHEMTSASPICLMARASSTKSWLWYQCLSHLNFDTINDLAKNDLVLGIPKFKYHKEHLCPSCEQGKSKRASHPPKPVPNSRQRLHLLHMDLCGPMRIASINGKRKPDIPLLHVFGALCYPKNDREDIRKLGAKGLDLTYAPLIIITQQPTEGELDILFKAMYDDFIGGQPSAAQRATHLQSETAADDVSNAMFDGNTFDNPFANPSISAAESSSSQNVDPSNIHTFYQPYPYEFQWTKDHPLEQVIGEPS
nr:putative ribonuclease H-like domain-containing protein [Tanacetum cinerariifolium]